ncbi:porphobilinogen deaminase [Abortiporus biennis]|nr:porphobilinogen deaminase [Abortiporus biennis]
MVSTSTSERTIILASRTSQLAQIQTNIVLDILRSKNPTKSFSTLFMTTGGDHNQSQALYLLGGKSLWTKELEWALLSNEAEGEGKKVDMLIHSFKDVPTVLPPGCEIAGVLEREDPVDSLVVRKDLVETKGWKTLEDLEDGSVVGTSSVRRVAQLKRAFPKLKFLDVRGNLNTRISKLDAPSSPYTALILAKAGLLRLGWKSRITSDIHPPTLYHAVSQGALAIEIRSNDSEVKNLCRSITDRKTEWRCYAERGLLRVLEGGCSVPVGVFTELIPQSTGEGEGGGEKEVLVITGCVTSLDGQSHVEHTLKEPVGSVEEAEAVGEKLAKILIETGAKKILDDINVDREKRVEEAKVKDEKVAQA